MSIESPSEGATVNGTVDVTGTASAPNGSIDQVEVRIDQGTWQTADGTSSWSFTWDTASESEGSHAIEARSWSGNNSSALDIVNVTVDHPNEPPTVSIGSPSEGANASGTVDITGSASDPDGSVQQVEVRIDGGSWQAASGTSSWSHSWNTSNVQDGQHTIEARAHDGETTSSLAMVNVTVDNQAEINEPPTVSISTPNDGATVDGTVQVSGSASDPDGSVQQVEVRTDGGSWQAASGTSSWSFSWETTNHQDGQRTIEARSFDGTNHSSIDQRTVTVDNHADGGSNTMPQVVIDRPSDGATVSGTVQIDGRAWDPDGQLAGGSVEIDGGTWQGTIGSGAWSLAWDSTQAAQGSHTIQATVHDDDGATQSTQITVTVEHPTSTDDGSEPSPNQVPSLTVSSPEEGETVQGEVLVAGTASDPDGNLDRLEMRLDDWGWRTLNASESWVHRWNMSDVPEGEHLLTVRLTDTRNASDIVMRRIHVGPGQGAMLETASHEDGNNTTDANTSTPPLLAPPTLEIEEPTEEVSADEALHVKGTVDAPGQAGPVTVRFKIDDGRWQSFETEPGTFHRNVSTADLPPGEHTLALLVEGDGGASEPQSTTFSVAHGGGPPIGLAVVVVAVFAGGGLIAWARNSGTAP